MCLETLIPFDDLGLHRLHPKRIKICTLTCRRSFTIHGKTMENDTAESQSSHEKKENLHGKALDEVSNRESAAFPQVFASIMEAEMQRW